MENRAIAMLQELIKHVDEKESDIGVWVSIPGSIVSGYIATPDEFAAHTMNMFFPESERESSISREDYGDPEDISILWLRDVSFVVGSELTDHPFCTVDLNSVAAWGFGKLERTPSDDFG